MKRGAGVCGGGGGGGVAKPFRLPNLHQTNNVGAVASCCDSNSSTRGTYCAPTREEDISTEENYSAEPRTFEEKRSFSSVLFKVS